MYEKLCVHRCIFFPLVQCTYIGPTVHIHNFLPFFLTVHFLHVTLIRLLFSLRLDSACLGLHLCCSPQITPIHLTSFIIWNDQPVVIIDHLSVCYRHRPPLPTKRLGNEPPEILSSIWSLPWRGPRRIREFRNKSVRKLFSVFDKNYRHLSMLIHYTRIDCFKVM